MELSDAISYFRYSLEQAHKFWGYYQAITAAAVAFAWASTKPPAELLIGLATVYLLFSLLNCRLIVASQVAALEIWRLLQDYKESPTETKSSQFLSLLKLNKPDNPILVAGMQIILSLFATMAILFRIVFVGCTQ
jgi:hypothetical protein